MLTWYLNCEAHHRRHHRGSPKNEQKKTSPPRNGKETDVEEAEEGDVLLFGSQLGLQVAEEEKVGQRGVQQVRMAARHADQVEAFAARVAAAPERHLHLVLPAHVRLRLHRQHVQRHPVVTKAAMSPVHHHTFS